MPLPSSLLSSTHTDIDFELVAGAWPDGVTGELYISAPAPTEGLGFALFGFGQIIRCSLTPGTHGAPADRWAWRTELIDSPTRRLYEAVPGAFRAGPLGLESAFGAPNMGNTAPLPWGDRLFATWDVGRPIEIDPVDLSFLGEVGHKRSWGDPMIPSTSLLPFFFSTAHPIVDPDRDVLWTVKLMLDMGSMALQPWLVRYDGDGTDVRCWPIEGASVAGSMHTISQTRDWLVLADSGNFKVDLGEMAGGPRTVTIDDEVRLYLVRKDVVEATAPGAPVDPLAFGLSPSTGHYYARYDDSDGRVHVLVEHMDRMDLGFNLRADDRDVLDRPIDPAVVGMYNLAMAPSHVTEVVIDPVAGTSEVVASLLEEWSWNHQLSAMDWSAEGLLRPTAHHIVFQGFKAGGISQRALAVYGDRVDRSRFPGQDTPGSLVTLARDSLDVLARWEYPNLEDLPGSPIFIPRDPDAAGTSRFAGSDPGGHDGWVLCPVLNDSGARLELFDAADVGRGPLAVLRGTRRETVPVLLHAAWGPPARPAPDRERLRWSDEIDEAALAQLDDDERAAVRDVADDLDGARR